MMFQTSGKKSNYTITKPVCSTILTRMNQTICCNLNWINTKILRAITLKIIFKSLLKQLEILKCKWRTYLNSWFKWISESKIILCLTNRKISTINQTMHFIESQSNKKIPIMTPLTKCFLKAKIKMQILAKNRKNYPKM